jgi:hypothetical protein
MQVNARTEHVRKLKFHGRSSKSQVAPGAIAHLNTAPGARPSGRFNIQAEMDETIVLWTLNDEAA